MKASVECACTALCFLHLCTLVASQYAPVQHRESTILIMGYSGHGKSTALNAMADAKKAFHVCASKKVACTKDVVSKEFSREIIGNDGKEYLVNVTLVDTPGFPDRSGDAEINDAVIGAARQYLNAVVWVVKPETSPDVTPQERVLLDEFNRVRVPIFQLVNGRKHYKDAEERKKRQRVDKAEMLVLADNMTRVAGVSVKGRFMSTTKPDLKDETQAIIYRSLSYAPLTSSLRSVEDIEADLKGQEPAIGSKGEPDVRQKDEL